MIDLTPIIQAIIGLCAALITVYLIPWIKSRTTREQQDKLRALVEIGVYAAEKAYGAGNGDLKLGYVEDWLEQRGVKVDMEQLQGMVDAEIKKMEMYDPAKLVELTQDPAEAGGGKE